MQNYRQLPGHGDLGLLEADAFPEPVPPGFELRPLRHPGEQHAGGLEQVGPDHAITAFGDSTGPIDLTRGMAARGQPDVGTDAPGTPEAARLVDRRMEDQALAGRAAIDILIRQVDEVLFYKPPP